MKRLCQNCLTRYHIICLIVSILCLTNPAFGENSISNQPINNIDNTSISGVVKDQQGVPMPGVTIFVLGTNSGCISDEAGKFEVAGVAGDDQLQFSFLGYSTETVTIGGRTHLEIVMKESSSVMDDVVVIGYGKQARATLTSSVAKLDTKTLENISFTNLSTALQGNIPGLRVQTISGQPGEAARIVLRGGTSINNPNGSSPLYIIDGIMRDNMNDVNSDNVENIEVLKDAAATAIYGARGSNGVVLITTKGANGKNRGNINYRYSLTMSDLRDRYELATAEEYIHFNRIGLNLAAGKAPQYRSKLDEATGYGTGNNLLNNTAYNCMYLSPDNEHKVGQPGWGTMQDPLDPTKTILYKDTDWQDVLFRTAFSHNHYLSFSGGGEDANFYGSLGYMKSQGIAISTEYQRLNADIGGSVAVRSNIRLNAKMAFSNSSDNEVYNTHHIFQRALALAPTTKYTFEDGTLAPGQNRSMGNPVYHLEKRKTFNNSNRLSIAFGGDWEILPGLVFAPTVSLYAIQSIGNFYQSAYLDGVSNTNDTRGANASHNLHWQRQFETTLNYTKSFNKHNLTALVGSSYYNRMNYALSAKGEGAVSDNIPTLNASTTPTDVSSSTSQHIISGYFGRVTYDYDKKYLVQLTARYDGASNLGRNNRYGFFPGVALGWNMHNESFMADNVDIISTLKPRFSYGVNGNISGLADFHAQGQYDLNGVYDTNGMALMARMANQDLRWERSSTLNLGLDLGLVDNRVTLLFDAYRRVTDNLLTDLALPHETGFASIKTNYGSLENKGVELSVDAMILKPESPSGVMWNVGFNVAYTKATVLELPENGNENNRIGGIQVYDPEVGDYVWIGGIQEGKPLGDSFAYRQLGIYKTDEEAANAPTDNVMSPDNKTKYGGDVIWYDADENGIIDDLDRVCVGNIYPDWTGGVSSVLSYKNFTFTLRGDFTLGHTIYNETRARLLGQFQGDINTLKDVRDSWQKPGDDTDIPRYWWSDQVAQSNLFRGNSEYYEKGDYFAIREVSLSYDFPNKWLEKLYIKDLRMGLTGNNLHYFTAYRGLAPEFGGTDSGRYPAPRALIFNINITF